MAIYGYARVSTDGQSLDAQVKQLRVAGAEKVFRETAGGARADRAQLRRLLHQLDKGDVLMVTRLDRLARSTRYLFALARVGQGNISNAKGVGEGVFEYRINWGPGYRVYFGRDGEVLVILLTGGTKQRQPRDIERAKALWADYKRRRKPPAR